MGRKASHRLSKPHPSKRFADKIMMLNYRRGPADDIWGASFMVDGKWQPKDGVSLGVRDWDEAIEVARDKYAALMGGAAIVKPRAVTPKVPEHALSIYAQRAIDKLLPQAAEEDAKVKGKGHNFRTQVRRIEDLLPRWGTTDITTLNEHELNHWIEHEYRVEDQAATVKKYGRQPRGENRQIVYKKPSMTTLGNLDWALSIIWDEAVADKVVERRKRPVIDKSFGEDSEPRAFIDHAGVQAAARVMTDEWMQSSLGHGTGMKRRLRAYVAMLGTTGIRSGLEAKRVRLRDVRFLVQQGKQVIVIDVLRNQGKHKNARNVVVYEGYAALPVRHLLADLKAFREAEGAGPDDYLFAWPDGGWPAFTPVLNDVLREAGALIDPLTGDKRVPYSYRHFFATLQIERGLSVPQIAAWMGTSSAMIEAHYNRFILERQAHMLSGAADALLEDVDVAGSRLVWDSSIGEYGDWAPG